MVISPRRLVAALLPVLGLLWGGPALAQESSGALYGLVRDDAGSPLRGATVTLWGEQGPPLRRLTNARGAFRFAGLAPGLYQGRIELEGFSPNEHSDIPIRVGGSTTIGVRLTPATSDAITLTAECPLLDERRASCGVTVTAEELEKIPTARDPWTILRQAPGVLLDRIDVGGSEAAHPAVARAPALAADQNVYSVDGVTLTDPEMLATTPTFYDFGSFAEMQVTTGGTHAAIATGGVVLNLVTKRGTNAWRVSARYLLADDRWQPGPDELAVGAGQAGFEISPRLERYVEHGADFGGPLARERLWMWAGYNDTEVEMALETPPTLFDQGAGDRDVDNGAAKLDLDVGPSHRLQGFVHRSRAAIARVGGGPSRALDATADLDAPTTIGKLGGTHVLGSALHLSTQLARVDGELELLPRGGDETPVIDAAGVLQASSLTLESERTRDQARIDTSAFFGAGAVGHELAAGVEYRRAEVESRSRWGGASSVLAEDPSASGTPTRLFFRPERSEVELDTWSGYVQDTLAIGSAIADVGLRYGRQRGERRPVTLPGNPLRPDLVPAVAVMGTDGGFDWETIVPRLGVTWALGERRTTFLRASYSRFADQLGTPIFAQALSAPDQSPFTFAAVRFLDLDGDTLPGASEPRIAVESVSRGTVVDPSLEAPTLDEVLWSVEHAGAGCFSVGGRLTWRSHRGLLEEHPFVRDGSGVVRVATRADYVTDALVTGTLPGGAPYGVPTFALRQGLEAIDVRFLTRGEREVEYRGATLWFERRLRARWRLRSFVNLRDEEWSVPAAFDEARDPTDLLGFGDNHAAPFGPASSFPDKSSVPLHAEWDYSIAGLYHARAGFSAAVLAHGRQGYPMLYYESALGTDGLVRRVAVTDERHPRRLPSVHQLNVRLEKEIRLGKAGLTLSADAFNLLNETPALARGAELDTPTADFVREIVSPRVLRMGARLRWR
ncbi:MAG TPA: TonB-dependent receptor [Thermoanaerobaculia bacterium]|nr:TonB-dependent receptor [Thermoanaerobaculia bacterium]